MRIRRIIRIGVFVFLLLVAVAGIMAAGTGSIPITSPSLVAVPAGT